jgi:DNA polymerase III subunit alpha
MEFINLHGHSLHSADSASKIPELVKYVASIGQSSLAITDHGNMSAVIKFQKECKSNKIKPILGCEFYICPPQQSSLNKSSANKKLNHLVVLAKNKIGYKNLLKLVYLSNSPDRLYYRPRIDEDLLFAHNEGLIVLNGHHTTSIWDQLIFNHDALEKCNSLDEAREYLFPNWEEKVKVIADRYRSVFGDDFYIECQLFDREDISQQLTGTVLFEFAKKYGFKSVGSSDHHYIKPENAKAHKTFVAIKQNGKVKNLPKIRYFTGNDYCVVTNEKAKLCYPDDLILATQEIANKVEEYEITGPQRIPSATESKELSLSIVKEMVYDGLKRIGKDQDQEYIDRVKYELEMIEKGELSDYFLIVKDYLDWARSNGILTGCGRGSVGGALIAFLLNITSIDSIKYDLMWDRFMGPDRIENKVLPDIDSDFQTSRREEVVEYIRNKFGEDKVCEVITFGMLQGKSAIKAVLSAWEILDHTQQKDISDRIQSKDKISDKLADFKEETGSDSILLYTLTHEPAALEAWVKLVDGKLEGELAPFFEIAIELEGSIKTESRHASALIISDRPIYEVAPMVKDKSKPHLLCAFDMYSFEQATLVKMDILGLKSLDGLYVVNELLEDIEIIDGQIQDYNLVKALGVINE